VGKTGIKAVGLRTYAVGIKAQLLALSQENVLFLKARKIEHPSSTAF